MDNDDQLQDQISSTGDDNEEKPLEPNSDDNSGEGEGDDSSKSKGRTAKDRIDDLRFQLEEKDRELQQLKQKPTEKIETPPSTPPEAQKVIEQLESLGFTRQKSIKDELNHLREEIKLENEHSRLKDEYDGSDGRPKYDETKINAYMRNHQIYDPEVAYKAMNEAELLDWNLKKKSDTSVKKQPYVAKAGGSSGASRMNDNSITREKLQEVTKNPTPANREWYERNRSKILQMVHEGQL